MNNKSADKYIKFCQRAVEDWKAGKLTHREAAEKIGNKPVPKESHPMLLEISERSWSIAANRRGEEKEFIMENWQAVVKMVADYDSGNWLPTCWMMAAMYGIYSNIQLKQSYSVVARRRNGKIDVLSSKQSLESVTKKIVQQVNPEQTDERYLKNLAKLLSPKVDDMKLFHVEVNEYLGKEWYATGD